MKKCFEDFFIFFYFLNLDGFYIYFGWINWVDEVYNDVGFLIIYNIDIFGKIDCIFYYFLGGYNW